MIIAFDVDGTLISAIDDTPRLEIVDFLKSFSKSDQIIVWSGGGCDYAKIWVDRLGLTDYVSQTFAKCLDFRDWIDICFDDEDVKLAKFNVNVNNRDFMTYLQKSHYVV